MMDGWSFHSFYNNPFRSRGDTDPRYFWFNFEDRMIDARHTIDLLSEDKHEQLYSDEGQ